MSSYTNIQNVENQFQVSQNQFILVELLQSVDPPMDNTDLSNHLNFD